MVYSGSGMHLLLAKGETDQDALEDLMVSPECVEACYFDTEVFKAIAAQSYFVQ